MACASAASRTSVCTNMAAPPAPVICAAVSCPPPSSTSATTTRTPLPARCCAMPRPMPDPAPVTIATRSLIARGSFLLVRRQHQLPPPFAVLPLVGRAEPGGGRDRGRWYVTWMDMRYDVPDLAPPQPGDERTGCLGGDAPALPGGAHHPGDLCRQLRGPGDRGLNGAGQAGRVAYLDHPVAPGHGGVRRPGGQPLVAGAQVRRGERGDVDERVRGGVGQYARHLLGVLGPERQQDQPAGADGLGLQPAHFSVLTGLPAGRSGLLRPARRHAP